MHPDPQSASVALVSAAYSKWLDNEQRTDDISCVIIRFDGLEQPLDPPNASQCVPLLGPPSRGVLCWLDIFRLPASPCLHWCPGTVFLAVQFDLGLPHMHGSLHHDGQASARPNPGRMLLPLLLQCTGCELRLSGEG